MKQKFSFYSVGPLIFSHKTLEKTRLKKKIKRKKSLLFSFFASSRNHGVRGIRSRTLRPRTHRGTTTTTRSFVRFLSLSSSFSLSFFLLFSLFRRFKKNRSSRVISSRNDTDPFVTLTMNIIIIIIIVIKTKQNRNKKRYVRWSPSSA